MFARGHSCQRLRHAVNTHCEGLDLLLLVNVGDDMKLKANYSEKNQIAKTISAL